MSVMASPGVGGCRVCAVRFVCGVCYWVLDGIGDRTGGSTGFWLCSIGRFSHMSEHVEVRRRRPRARTRTLRAVLYKRMSGWS